MDVSVIIVNYKTPQLVIDCIQSIREKTTGVEYEVIVVDNHSDDGSVKKIKEVFPEIYLIENDENYGFAKANNIGVRESLGEYLFFLNSDTVLVNNAIYELWVKAKSDKKYGALGCWLLDGDNEPTLSAAQFTTVKNSSDEYTVLIKNKFRKEKKICDKYLFTGNADLTVVDVVIGADLFVNRELFFQADMFDEDFFMYHEEMHLCYKINQLGKINVIINEAKIIHLCGKSPKTKVSRDVMIDKNLFLYFKKTGVNKLPWWFGIKFFGVRVLFYLKNRYPLADIKEYVNKVSHSQYYKQLKN